MKVFAIYNIKGGVGKTSTAVNLGWLSAQHTSTLLIDLDPQSALSYYLRIHPRKKQTAKKMIKKPKVVEKFIRGSDFENLDLLPADFSYRHLDLTFNSGKKNDKHLKKIIREFRDDYEHVIIDCPPNITLVSENIFQAADVLLVPTIPTFLSQLTLEKLVDFFREEGMDETKIWPFFSMVEKRKKVHQTKMEELRREFRFLEQVIPYLSDIEKMGGYREPVCSARRHSQATLAYGKLWQEILQSTENIH